MRIGLIIKICENEDSAGIFRKYRDMQNAFIELKHSCDLISPYHSGININGVYYNNEQILNEKLVQMFFESIILRKIDLGFYDILIFRYHLATPWLLRLLKKVKDKFQKIKIYIELPTYPYIDEYHGVLGRGRILIDNIYRRILKHYVDGIITYSEDKFIFSIPCINISNGINCKRYTLLKRKKDNKEIKLIAIGKLWNWYGLDRVIEGLKNYYQRNNEYIVRLIIIGDGIARNKLIELTKKYNLESYVDFLGTLNDKECDEFFEKADLGIGTLGAHRKELSLISSLKHREFTCRGIPFIYSGIDKAFSYKTYAKQILPNDTPIDIQNLIEYSKKLKEEYHPCTLREDGCRELTWENQLSRVLDAAK